MRKILSKIKGFTLAEVLITLVIVGIIVSLTIPALIQNTQDFELKTAWKHQYSIFEQATRLLLLNNNGGFNGLCTNYDDNCLKDLYKPYLNITKSCLDGQSYGNCWHNDQVVKELNGTLMPTGWIDNAAGVILNNGTFLQFEQGLSNCSSPRGNLKVCGYLHADINGLKGPNTVGRDVYIIYILNNSIKPMGVQGDGNEGSCDPSDIGWGCSTQYLFQ